MDVKSTFSQDDQFAFWRQHMTYFWYIELAVAQKSICSESKRVGHPSCPAAWPACREISMTRALRVNNNIYDRVNTCICHRKFPRETGSTVQQASLFPTSNSRSGHAWSSAKLYLTIRIKCRWILQSWGRLWLRFVLKGQAFTGAMYHAAFFS